MIIAQISDIHIAAPGKKTYNIAPMAENLAATVAHINGQNPRPDVVIVTGDIAMNGLQSEVERAADILNELAMPYFIVPGNHDDREKLWNVFGNKACPAKHDDFISFVVDDYAVRLIGLDTTIPGKPGGEIGEKRAQWLDERLSENTEKPTVLFMHHPPVKCSVLETDEDGFIGVERLANIVDKYSNIEKLLCGHIHLLVNVRWHGTVVSTAPSTGMELLLDLNMKLESAFLLTPPGYQLHYWTPQGDLISHNVTVGAVNGPYLFEEYPEK